MMKRFITSLGLLFLGASAICAQQTRDLSSDTPVQTPADADNIPGGVVPGQSCGDARNCCTGPSSCYPQAPAACAPCIWAGSEYLLWAVSHAPITVPLVTGNNNGSGLFIGAINEPGTTSLLGSGSGTSTSFGWLSGGRFTLGGRLAPDDILGVEVSGFFLQEGVVNFSRNSVGGDNPIVSIPFNATQPFPGNPAGPTALSAGGAPNVVSAQLTSQLWGLEANQLILFKAYNGMRWSGLLGLRYIDLKESLNLKDTFLDTETANTLAVNDSFSTHNQFYGFQLGTRFEYNTGRWGLDTTLKVAVGPNVESTTIAGATVVNGGAFGFASGSYPGGVFAQTSNIGHYEQSVFAVVPEVTFKVRYAITQNLQSFVGYNFMYISETDRPGNQINSNVNPTQNVIFGGGTEHGAPAPVNAFQSSGFWAQGFSIGLELRY